MTGAALVSPAAHCLVYSSRLVPRQGVWAVWGKGCFFPCERAAPRPPSSDVVRATQEHLLLQQPCPGMNAFQMGSARLSVLGLVASLGRWGRAAGCAVDMMFPSPETRWDPAWGQGPDGELGGSRFRVSSLGGKFQTGSDVSTNGSDPSLGGHWGRWDPPNGFFHGVPHPGAGCEAPAPYLQPADGKSGLAGIPGAAARTRPAGLCGVRQHMIRAAGPRAEVSPSHPGSGTDFTAAPHVPRSLRQR